MNLKTKLKNLYELWSLWIRWVEEGALDEEIEYSEYNKTPDNMGEENLIVDGEIVEY